MSTGRQRTRQARWIMALALMVAGCAPDTRPSGVSVEGLPTSGHARPAGAATLPAARSSVARRSDSDSAGRRRLLVFTRTAGFRHASIPVAVRTLHALASTQALDLVHTEDAGLFDDAVLPRFDAVVFASTTGDVLDGPQRAALRRFVEGGGGFLGIHAAADTLHAWPWYADLVGAMFASHPPGLQRTRVRFEGRDASSLPWRVVDELYNYDRNPRSTVRVVATVDERDYIGGTMGADHPIAWCHARLGGRAWYTGLGHESALYGDARFREHLVRGLRYVTGRDDAC